MITESTRIAFAAVLVVATNQLSVAQFFPGLAGDYSGNRIVSHADYSVLGDTLGSASDLRADGDNNGSVNLADFDFYAARFGNIGQFPNFPIPGPPSVPLPLSVTAAKLPSGNLQWTFAFSNLNGSIAGHLNISSTETILSVVGGPGFLDNGTGPIGVPGMNNANIVQYGISFTASQAFVSLGTSLLPPQALLNSNSALDFIRVVTKNLPDRQIPTTLTFAGEFGYVGRDYLVNASSYVPEPGTWQIACLAGCLAFPARVFSRRN